MKRHSPTQVRPTPMTTRSTKLETNRSGDRPAKEESLDMEVRSMTTGFKLQAPIKMVDGRPWSPGVYKLLRLLGKTLEVAWERAFIQTTHFQVIIFDY